MKYSPESLKEAIDAYWRKNSCAPSYRDLLEATGMKSLSHLRYCLKALVDEGYLLPLIAKGQTRAVVPAWVKEAIEEARGRRPSYR